EGRFRALPPALRQWPRVRPLAAQNAGDGLAIADLSTHHHLYRRGKPHEALANDLSLLRLRGARAELAGGVERHAFVQESRTCPKAQSQLPLRRGIAGFLLQLALCRRQGRLASVDAPRRQLPQSCLDGIAVLTRQQDARLATVLDRKSVV